MKKLICMLMALMLLCGCGVEAKTNQAPDFDKLYTELQKTLPEMLPIGQDLMLDFYGIEAEKVKQVKLAINANSLLADELWLVEAVDEAAAKEILELAQTRLSQKDDESVTYSPEQNAVVKKAFLERKGSCVILIVSPDVDKLSAQVNAAFGK